MNTSCAILAHLLRCEAPAARPGVVDSHGVIDWGSAALLQHCFSKGHAHVLLTCQPRTIAQGAAGWDEIGQSRCTDLHRGEDWTGGDEAAKKLAHTPSTRRCSILSTMRRSRQEVERRSRRRGAHSSGW